MFARPSLTINLNRIVDNYLYFSRNKNNPSTIMAAVVKDNAYGLGDSEVARILYRQGNCHTFFVAHGFEGHHVRQVAPQANIYVLQGPGEEDMPFFAKDNLIPVISSPAQLAFWKQETPNQQKPALQIETGLNRLGFRESEILTLSETERSKFGLVLSHLACADTPKNPQNKKQLFEFTKLKEFFPKAKLSLSASDGFLLGDEFHFDIVRLGAVLYGLNPVLNCALKSKNVVLLKAPILQIADVFPGEVIGYGGEYQVTQKSKIAIVSIGYGDGIFRSFFPRGKVWIRDEKNQKSYPAPLVGRVSMDNLICDVGKIPNHVLSQTESAVIIDDLYTCDDFAQDCGTIGYEVLSAIGHGIRFNRTYSKNF